MSAYETDVSLGHTIFAGAQLGDQRRTKRLIKTFEFMQRAPGGTLPDKLASPVELRALYRLRDCDDVRHAALIDAGNRMTCGNI